MKNLLVVDDERIARVGIESLLRPAFADEIYLYSAADGQEALHIIENHPVDIVLSDIRMPKMSGIELSEVLRERFPEIVIIFLSGYDDFSYVQKSLQNKAFDYLLKPIDEDNLVRCIRRGLEEAQKRREQVARSDLLDKHFSGEFAKLYDLMLGIRFQHAFDASDSGEMTVIADHLFEMLRQSVDTKSQMTEALKGIYNLSLRTLFENEQIDLALLPPLVCSDDIEEDELRLLFDDRIRKAREIYLDNKVERSKINRIRNYIEKNHTQDLSLQSVADEFGISSSYLSDMFSKQAGKSFHQYLTDLRMDHAIELLTTTEKKIYEVAELIGYLDYNTFQRAFKKATGCSPAAFRDYLSK